MAALSSFPPVSSGWQCLRIIDEVIWALQWIPSAPAKRAVCTALALTILSRTVARCLRGGGACKSLIIYGNHLDMDIDAIK